MNVSTSNFSPLVGQNITMKVVTGDVSVPVTGLLLSEAPQTVRLRVGGTWDLDIYKNMIQSVEQESWVCSVT